MPTHTVNLAAPVFHLFSLGNPDFILYMAELRVDQSGMNFLLWCSKHFHTTKTTLVLSDHDQSDLVLVAWLGTLPLFFWHQQCSSTLNEPCYIHDCSFISTLWDLVPPWNPVLHSFVHVWFSAISMHDLCDLCDPATWPSSLLSQLPHCLSIITLFISEPCAWLNSSLLFGPPSWASPSSPILHCMVPFHLQITFWNTYSKTLKIILLHLYSWFCSPFLFHIIFSLTVCSLMKYLSLLYTHLYSIQIIKLN